MKKLKYFARYLVSKVCYSHENKRAKNLVKEQRITGGYQRIYHFHIRKTGGTSINFAFFALNGEKKGRLGYDNLSKNRFNYRSIIDRNVYVGWDRYLLQTGDYFYGFSHLPTHAITIPVNTYCFTILRDPISRIISHYKMLRYYSENSINLNLLRSEPWYNSDIINFIENMPTDHLLRQLFMFSKDYDINEAIANLSKLNRVMFTESFDEGCQGLRSDLKIPIEIYREKSYNIDVAIDNRAMKLLELKMSREVEFYNSAREIFLNN